MTIAGRTFRQLTDEVLEFQFAVGKYEPLTKRWLNDAQQEAVIQSEFRTQETVASYKTVSGEEALALPEDFSRFIELSKPEVTELLRPVSRQEFDVFTASTGRPVVYVISSDEIFLYPTPDAVYEISLRYWRLPQDMTKDADLPEIPAQYHDLLVAYAMSKAYARENDYQASNFWKTEWEAGVMKMRGEVQSDTFDGPQQVAGSWGDPHEQPRTNVWT